MFENEQEFDRLIASLPIDTLPDPGHRDALRQRMLDQFAQAQKTRPSGRPGRREGRVRRFPIMTRYIGIAAAVVVAAVGIALTVWLTGGAEIGLADVQKRLAAVPVIAFRMETSRPGGTAMDAQTYVTEDSIARFEMGQAISIIDFRRGRMLNLMPRGRFAIEGNMENLRPDQKAFQQDWLAHLRRIVGSDDARSLGAKTVDGVRAVGWQVKDGGWLVTVWADAKTAELVRVEFLKDQTRMTFREFRYDVKMDKAMFALAAPAGYTVRRVTIDASRSSEREVVLILRIWAMGNGDVFPDGLDAMKFAQAANKVDWDRLKGYMPEVDSDDKFTQVIQQAFSWLAYDPTWHYAGAGVRLGDADTPIFWYRPEGSNTYRVIYGNLRVADADSPPAGS